MEQTQIEEIPFLNSSLKLFLERKRAVSANANNLVACPWLIDKLKY